MKFQVNRFFTLLFVKEALNKSNVFSMLIILSCILFSFATHAVGKTDPSLVGYWPFNEKTGKKAEDASGNGNDGKLIDGPKWVEGKFGSALEFGGGSYVEVADNPSLDLINSATLMAWFKLTDKLTNTSRMMSKNNSIFVIFDFSNKSSLDFLVKPDNDFVESKIVDWKQGNWYHFAGSFARGKMNIYINGQLEGEKENAAGIAPSDLDLWIGADDWKMPASSFPGIIDEVRIYNKALTEGKIKKLMTTPMAVSKTLDKLPVTWSRLKIKR